MRHRKEIYFKMKFMIKYNSATNKTRHFVLLNIRIKMNFESHSIIRNSNENKLIWGITQCEKNKPYGKKIP